MVGGRPFSAGDGGSPGRKPWRQQRRAAELEVEVAVGRSGQRWWSGRQGAVDSHAQGRPSRPEPGPLKCRRPGLMPCHAGLYPEDEEGRLES